jgi:hypothetical protein
MSRRVAVVGAGAAGLTAAIRAAEAGAAVTLLNAHPKIGLKVLMSGGTRCNVTHREVTERDYHGGSRPFVRRVLVRFTVEETLAWFDALDVPLKLEETGKYFPVTDDAQTVLDALLGAVRAAGVEVRTGARVVRLERGTGGSGFRLGIQDVADSAAFAAEVRAQDVQEWPLPVVAPNRWLEADAVVLATGGLSFPRTGSDGTGYALAAALGHSIEPPCPALTPLTSGERLCRILQGVSIETELRLRAGGVEVASVAGPLLFTHFGYSGPAVLDLSRHWLRAAGHGDREVLASFLPGIHAEDLDEYFVNLGGKEPKLTLRRALARLIPERFADEVILESKAMPVMALSQAPRPVRQAVVANVMRRPLRVTGSLGYEKAEVTAGGVRLAAVDPATLESRVVPGLHFCGEMLDVEGRLGGFNFQWAWSSGTVAGRSAAKSPPAVRVAPP